MIFLTKLRKPAGNYALIAEIKLKSLTEGILGSESQVAAIVRQYQEGGADALSVVTERKLFGGSLNLIRQVKKAVELPILCKDFVSDQKQLKAIEAAGADAVLPLARFLDDRQLAALSREAQKLKMLPIIEADNVSDLKRLIRGEFPVVAVNARNLGDMTVDKERACRMLKMIFNKAFTLAFSGVKNSHDIKKYLDCGAKGILIGTTLMKANNRIKLIKEFKKFID